MSPPYYLVEASSWVSNLSNQELIERTTTRQPQLSLLLTVALTLTLAIQPGSFDLRDFSQFAYGNLGCQGCTLLIAALRVFPQV